jgi:SAM-dependent methyltransferase
MPTSHCAACGNFKIVRRSEDVQVDSGKTIKHRERLLPGLSVKDGFTRHPFDVEFGVRTSGLIAGRHLSAGHCHDRHNTAYYGVAPSVFRSLVARWRRSPQGAPLDEYTFVDLGAGMGRAVLLAAEYRFKAVVGVELNPTLARIAKQNLTLWRKMGKAVAPMRLQLGDAVEFDLPPGPSVAFLFNPFRAPVLRRLLKGVAKAFSDRPGQFDLLYVNHEHEDVLEMEPGFQRLFIGKVARSRVDAIADHAILANQPEGEYASSNYEDCSVWRWVGKQGSGKV